MPRSPIVTVHVLVVLAVFIVGAASALECFEHDRSLRLLGETTIAQDQPREFCVVGDAAYSLGLHDPFVAVYDLRDPAGPQELPPLPLPVEPAAIAAREDWLLVAAPDLGLVRYDLSDPFAPVADDTLDLGTGLLDVAVQGDLAAVSTIHGVRMIDLDFPAGMIGLGTYATPSVLEAVAIDGAHLYLAARDHGLMVLDASDPTWLQPVGAAAFVGAAQQVAVGEGLAVVVGRHTDGTRGQATAYDVSGDPVPSPRASFAFDRGQYGRAIPRIVGPDRAILTVAGTGVHEYAIVASQFAPVGFLPGPHADIHLGAARYAVLSESRLLTGEPAPLPAPPLEVAGAGQHAVVHDDLVISTHDEVLTVVQMDAPGGPQQLGSTTLAEPGIARLCMARHGPAVYVGAVGETIEVVDLAVPADPQVVATLSLQAEPTGMVVAGQVLVVFMEDWGLATWDLTDPRQPQLVTVFGVDVGADRGAVARGDEILVGTTSGVDVYDVSDPAAVMQVDNLPGRSQVSDLALAGDRLLVTDRVQTTQVWQRDADTGEWTLLGTVPASRLVSTAVGGDVGYLLGEYGEVTMLDLRDPGVPPVVATLPTSFVADNYVVAGADWFSVPRGSDHRLYPPPCLADPTAVDTAPSVAGLTLSVAPNPFNPRTRLTFTLRRPAEVTLRIFDLRGREVASLLDRRLPAGRHEIDWRGVDQAGRSLSSGVYGARLTAAGTTVNRALTLLK